MIGPLIELLRRQASAVVALESRLRALELVVAAGEQRFLGPALDEVETASDELAGLELARSLAVATGGLSASITADALLETVEPVDGADALALRTTIKDLRVGMSRLADARSRADSLVRSAALEHGCVRSGV